MASLRTKRISLCSLAVVGFGLFLGGCESSPIRVYPARCASLHGPESGSGCDLAENRQLSLLVVAPATAKLAYDTDRGPLRILSERIEGDERLLSVEVPPGASSLKVSDSAVLHKSQGVSVALRDQKAHEAPWLTQARKLFEDSKTEDAEALLNQHLGDAAQQPDSRESHALALGLLAKIATDRNDPKALELLNQTLAECHREQLLTCEAHYSLRKTWLLSNHLHRYDEADQFLQEQQPLFKQLPEHDVWNQLVRAGLQKAMGNLRGALTAYDQAERPTRLFANADALTELNTSRAMTLVLMGRLATAKKVLDANTEPTELCRRGMQLNTKGWMQSLARQTMQPSDPLWPAFDPKPALGRAVELLQGCKQPEQLANALTNLAHTAALSENTSEVANWLGRAKAAQPAPTANLEMEWAELDGQLALWRRDWPSAMKHYQQLGRLGQKEDMYESVWAALIGQARASETLTPQRAAQLYAQAEEYLDQRSLEMPISTGRGTFLGRFERGTARYLDLLVSQGQHVEAVQLVRHARARGLWALGLLSRANTLSGERRRLWQQALVRYRKTRQELDYLATGATQDAMELQEENKRVQQQRKLDLLQQLDQTLRELGTKPLEKDFRRPQPGELMLTCHPRAIRGWHCFVWDEQGIQHLQVDQMDEPHLDAALVAARAKLQDARRLHVIAYGAMRQLDIHELPGPLAKQPLDEQLDVEYALDLPPVQPAPGATGRQKPKTGLLLVDPQGTTRYSRRAAEPIKQAMEQAGWNVIAQATGGRRLGEYPGKPQEGGLLDSAQLRTQLGRVTLFHYSGHAEYVPQGGWLHQLHTADDEAGPGVMLADILMLEEAPERVLLFACQSGVSDEENGAIEGLGLAQAFLLRGSSWVIATGRIVADQTAAEVATSLYRHGQDPKGVTGETPDPVGQLRVVRSELLVGKKDPAHRRDLAPFRVFVP